MYAVLGSDGTVGGPGGSPLSSSVALISSPNVFRADADEHTPVTIIPHSQSQAADLFRVENSAGSPLLEVSPTGRLTVTSQDTTSFRTGPGTPYGSPPAAPTVSLIAGSLSGTYQYVYTEHDTSGETTPSPAASAAPSGQGVQVIVPPPRRGITERTIYRTKAGGSTFYKLYSFGDGYYQTIYEDNTPDSSLSASSPPDVDGTRLYVYEANNQVQYFRLSPADVTSDDITFLTAQGRARRARA